jgi:hypothetical protein
LTIALTVLAMCFIGLQILYVQSVGGLPTIEEANPKLQLQSIVLHPLAFVGVIAETFRLYATFLASSTIGILGWLDTWLPDLSYFIFAVVIALTLCVQVASFSRISWRSTLLGSMHSCFAIAVAVLLASSAATILIFVSQYLTWTPLGHGVVQGVQGRYFFAPILLAATILTAALVAWSQVRFSLNKNNRVVRIGDAFPVFLIFSIVVSQHFTAWVLLDRYYLAPALASNVLAQPKFVTAISAAVAPSSQTAAANIPVTGYATIINAGRVQATDCSIALPMGVSADFLYQPTDPASNAPIGSRNTPTDIAPGQAQTFLFIITPSKAFSTDISLTFVCTNSHPAPVVQGVNTLRLIVTGQ